MLVRRLKGEHLRKKPFKTEERGLRWPGFSLEQELEKIAERIDFALIMMVIIPALAVAMYAVEIHRQENAPGFMVMLVIIALCGLGWAMVSLLRDVALSQRGRLGMRAEQLVGETLNGLMREGFFVFHDFPLVGRNIDHVLISENGVFSVETKARRKHKKVASGKGEYNLEFDGEKISYPENPRYENDPVSQARRSARDLEKFIEELARIKLTVTPLLVFPGWYVKRKAKSDVSVLSHTEIRTAVTGGKREKLSKDVVERVVAAVESRCRDVVW